MAATRVAFVACMQGAVILYFQSCWCQYFQFFTDFAGQVHI